MIKHVLLILTIIFCGMIVFPQTTNAFDIFPSINCNDAENADSAVCRDRRSDDPLSGSNGVLLKIVDIVAFAAGIAAIIVIIIGGIYYMTANGDAGNIKSARDTILYALIGLAVIVFARLLIVFVINRI